MTTPWFLSTCLVPNNSKSSSSNNFWNIPPEATTRATQVFDIWVKYSTRKLFSISFKLSLNCDLRWTFTIHKPLINKGCIIYFLLCFTWPFLLIFINQASIIIILYLSWSCRFSMSVIYGLSFAISFLASSSHWLNLSAPASTLCFKSSNLFWRILT